jgi:hypothetical protein
MQGHSKVLIPVKVLSKPFAVVRQQSYVLVVAETHTKTAPKNPKLNWSIVVVVGDDAQGYSTHHLTSAIAPRSRIVSHPRHLLLKFRGMFVLHGHNSTPAVVARSLCCPHRSTKYILETVAWRKVAGHHGPHPWTSYQVNFVYVPWTRKVITGWLRWTASGAPCPPTKSLLFVNICRSD